MRSSFPKNRLSIDLDLHILMIINRTIVKAINSRRTKPKRIFNAKIQRESVFEKLF